MKRGPELEPSVFLEKYFRERNMAGDARSALADDIRGRAEEARESFKRIRLQAKGEEPLEELTAAEKYTRRLENNRSSAAASRVYKEVLQKETEFTLRDVAARAEQYEAQVKRLAAEADKRKVEADQMRETISRLEAQLTANAGVDAPSPVKVDDAPHAFEESAPSIPSFSQASLPPLSAASFPDSAQNKALIDNIAEHNGFVAGARDDGVPSQSDASAGAGGGDNAIPPQFGASQGSDAHVRYGGSLPRSDNASSGGRSLDDSAGQPERLRARADGAVVATGNLEGSYAAHDLRYSLESQSQSMIAVPPHLSSQDVMKMETPESIDDNLPGLFSQTSIK